ncbi:MAG: CheY-like [Rhodospirillaceae bacterium]|nr:MAG: CheY-like [Rhodospirillaceae bacterium]TNC96424.1 MAG: CheY-like receiver [Stygiobacter sp.]
MTWQDHLDPGTILVADDMPLTLSTIEHLLTRTGSARPAHARCGLTALEALDADHQQRFRLLISDFYMPNLNGLELIRRLRAGETRARRDMHVVVLSGETDISLVEAARLLDVDAVLPKPISRAQLHQTLDLVLSHPRHIRDAAHYRGADIAAAALDLARRAGLVEEA